MEVHFEVQRTILTKINIPFFIAANSRVFQTAQFFIREFLDDQYNEEMVKTVQLSEKQHMDANCLTPGSF